MQSARAHSTGKVRKSRNPFPGVYFFTVPLALYESGLAARLTGSEFKRYTTLLRLSNYRYGSQKIQATLKELAELDGVSVRRAWLVNRKLQERGLVKVENTKPITYVLVPPAYWPDVDQTAAYLHPAQVKSTKGVPEPLHWRDIAEGD